MTGVQVLALLGLTATTVAMLVAMLWLLDRLETHLGDQAPRSLPRLVVPALALLASVGLYVLCAELLLA